MVDTDNKKFQFLFCYSVYVNYTNKQKLYTTGSSGTVHNKRKPDKLVQINPCELPWELKSATKDR